MQTMSEVSKEILRNSYSTLKWIWAIVMALAVEQAVETFIYYVDPTTGVEIIRDWRHFYMKDVLIFIIFIVTIVRFYHGDSRYLDRTYLESRLEGFGPRRAPSARSRFFDFYFLLCHAIIFYVLAASQRYFLYFFYVYIFLLFFNSIWLGTTYLRAPKKEDVRFPRNWAVNNIIHVYCLLSLYFLTNELASSYSHIAFFFLALSNSFFDYFTTWSYYFPRIEETEILEVSGQPFRLDK